MSLGLIRKIMIYFAFFNLIVVCLQLVNLLKTKKLEAGANVGDWAFYWNCQG